MAVHWFHAKTEENSAAQLLQDRNAKTTPDF
jgi:hypothetical protein